MAAIRSVGSLTVVELAKGRLGSCVSWIITLDSLDRLRDDCPGKGIMETGGVGGHRYWGLWYPEEAESIDSLVSWLSCLYSSCNALISQGDCSQDDGIDRGWLIVPERVRGFPSDNRLTGEYLSLDRYRECGSFSEETLEQDCRPLLLGKCEGDVRGIGEMGDRGEWGGKVFPPSGNCKYGPGDTALWLFIRVSTSDTTSWGISGGFSITVIRPVLLFLGESGEWEVDPP